MVSGLTFDEHATVRAAACRTLGVLVLIPTLREVRFATFIMHTSLLFGRNIMPLARILMLPKYRAFGVQSTFPKFGVKDELLRAKFPKFGVKLSLTVIQDPTFLSDAARSLIESMKDENLNVRVRACWSLANLCDTLVVLRYYCTTPVHSDNYLWGLYPISLTILIKTIQGTSQL